METNFENTPLTIMLASVLVFQFFSKRREVSLVEMSDTEKISFSMHFYKFIFCFGLSKIPEWLFTANFPDLLHTYHGLPSNQVSQRQLILYIFSFILGPSLSGYLGDRAGKKTAILLLNLAVFLASALSLFTGSINAQISFLTCLAIANSLMMFVFHNWLNLSISQHFLNPKAQEVVLSSIYEK